MIELRILSMLLKDIFQTSGWQESDRQFILVKINSDGLSGYGEVTAPSGPYYGPETVKTAWHILEDYLIPTLKQNMTPEEFVMKTRKVRGHHMAKAGLELALFDLRAKLAKKPLFEFYGGIGGEIAVGVSIGIKKDIKELLDTIGSCLNKGYRRIKIKIRKDWDMEVLRAIRKEYGSIALWADANGHYSSDDLDYLRRIDDYDLELLEQPLPPDDLLNHARLRSLLRTKICLDESIQSLANLKAALNIGAIDILNLKVGRVGGITESKKILEFVQEKDIPVWLGGMLESGVGRAHNLHLASHPSFVLPPDLSASSHYYKKDIIDPPFILKKGRLIVPDEPGIGVSVREDLIEHYTVLKKQFNIF